MCESFFSTLECELLSRRKFASQTEAKTACFSYIEGFYNPVRLHSAIGYKSPIHYERELTQKPKPPDNRPSPSTVHKGGATPIARHVRSYKREDFVFDPLHYLALLERKIGALDQAAPLAGWALPEEFATLRRLLEARMGKQGKREFVQVLRLMEVFTAEDVAAGVRAAIARGAVGFEAVKHLVLCRIERRPPRLDMTVYPYLPRAHVAATSARTYLDLLAGTAS